MPTPAQPNSPNFPPFGLLKSSSSFRLIPPGNTTVQLVRPVGDSVEYVPPPTGQGIASWVWERDPGANPPTFLLRAPAADLGAAAPLAQWRGGLAPDFPNGVVQSLSAAGTKRFTAFARALLTLTAELHRAKWRLGLTGPENVYVIERDKVSLFLPDLGFAWVGLVATTKPNWLGATAADRPLWSEERTLRQYAAPTHYEGRHPAITAGNPAGWAELVQQDLRVCARLFRFALTGDAGAAEPAGAKSCPIWRTIRDAEAGKYVATDTAAAAEQMRDALLAALGVPLRVPTEPKSGAVPVQTWRKWPRAIAACLAVTVAVVTVAVVGVVMFTKDPTPSPDVVKKDEEKEKPKTNPSVTDAIAASQAIRDIAEKARKALELSQRPDLTGPDKAAVNEFQKQTRAEVLAEIKKYYAAAQQGQHLPLKTQELYALYKQFPETP